MQIDENEKALERVDQERFLFCRLKTHDIEAAVKRLNGLLAEAAELDLSVRIEFEIVRAKEGKRAISSILHVSCAQLLP